MGDWELGVFPVRSAAAERFDRSQSAWSYSERWQPPGENLHSAEAAASTTLEPKKTSKPKSLIDQSLKHGVSHEHWPSVLLPRMLCKRVGHAGVSVQQESDPQKAALGSAVLAKTKNWTEDFQHASHWRFFHSFITYVCSIFFFWNIHLRSSNIQTIR